MSLFNLSKFVSVPILIEWLMKSDILVLDSALVNNGCRSVYLKLMNEYFNLFIESEAEMNLIEVCSWYLKFGIPKKYRLNNCLVRCRKYDWNMLKCREGLMEAAKCVMGNVSRLQCYHYNPILKNAEKVTDLCLADFKIPSIDVVYSFCSLLSLTILDYVEDVVMIALLRQSPLLTALDVSMNDSLFRCVAVHCTKLKIIKISYVCDPNVLLLFIFHCPSILSEWYVGGNDFVVRLLLWYRGAQLTQLTLDASFALRNYELLNSYPSLLFYVSFCSNSTKRELLKLIKVCGCHINGFYFYGLKHFSIKVKKQLTNSLDLSKILTLELHCCLRINIKWFPCLITLSLVWFSVTKEMFCSLGAYQHLQSVAINGCSVDVEVLMCLLTGQNLIEVNFGNNKVNCSDSFEDHYEIVTNKVNKLSLTRVAFSLEIFTAIIKRCNNLTDLDLSNCYTMMSQHLLNVIPCRKLINFAVWGDFMVDDTLIDAIHMNCTKCKLVIDEKCLTEYGRKLLKQHNSF